MAAFPYIPSNFPRPAFTKSEGVAHHIPLSNGADPKEYGPNRCVFSAPLRNTYTPETQKLVQGRIKWMQDWLSFVQCFWSLSSLNCRSDEGISTDFFSTKLVLQHSPEGRGTSGSSFRYLSARALSPQTCGKSESFRASGDASDVSWKCKLCK